MDHDEDEYFSGLLFSDDWADIRGSEVECPGSDCGQVFTVSDAEW